MQFLLRRFPNIDQILPVFAVIAFFSYGRGLYIFALKFPAWLFFLTIDEIFANLAYGLIVNLLESLLILFAFLIVAFVLPPRLFKDSFTVHGTWVTAFFLGSILIYFKCYSSIGPDFNAYIYVWIGATLALVVPFAYLGGRLLFLKKAAIWCSDRVIVFLYLLIPASLVSLVAVILRNLS